MVRSPAPSPARPRALARACSAILVCACAQACSPAPAPPSGPPLDVEALFPPPTITLAATTALAATAMSAPEPAPSAHPSASATGTLALPVSDPPCQRDEDCGYDPEGRRCGADPRWNKQPPVVDQGMICYCDAQTSACALLRVDPVPCEGDTSCAVHLDPRPHPVRASAAHPYEKPRPCRSPKRGAAPETRRHVTCERTNICTMHTRECARSATTGPQAAPDPGAPRAPIHARQAP